MAIKQIFFTIGMVKILKEFFVRPRNQNSSWKIRKILGLYAFKQILFTISMVNNFRSMAQGPRRLT